MPPQGTDLVLTTHIPHGELDVLVLNRLNIEAYFTRNSFTRSVPDLRSLPHLRVGGPGFISDAKQDVK